MPYVVRDLGGEIIRASLQPLPNADHVPADDPTLLRFLEASGVDHGAVEEAFAELRQSDTHMGRVIEDVVNVLMSKGMLKLQELPREAQMKLSQRVRLRVQIQTAYNQASATCSRKNGAFAGSGD